MRDGLGSAGETEPARFAQHPPPKTLDPSGPAVVAIGGGHGLARSLGALRRYAGAITAVVSVADDGGSSGRLRDLLGIPAPGDIRRCLIALAPEPSAFSRALEHRFEVGELEGHAFGNLLLAALDATTGDFAAATHLAGELLGAVGTVLPAASVPVRLRALAESGEVVGQVAIMACSGILELSLDPPAVEAPPAAIAAITAADQIVVGPGSLYTSVLAALAPSGIAKAIARADAPCIYVANLREQIAETAGYDVAHHVHALYAHGIRPDVVVCDLRDIALGDLPAGIEVHEATLTGRHALAHDEELLAKALAALR